MQKGRGLRFPHVKEIVFPCGSFTGARGITMMVTLNTTMNETRDNGNEL